MRLLSTFEKLILLDCNRYPSAGCVVYVGHFYTELDELIELRLVYTYERQNVDGCRRLFITELGKVYVENPELPVFT